MLPLAHRSLLRDAAVLGTFVRLDVLAEAREELSLDDDDRWVILSDFVEPAGPNLRRFRHEIIRCAAYEGLPYRRRRALHARVGARLEDEHAGFLFRLHDGCGGSGSRGNWQR